jgi:hypothetical protein
MVQIVIGFRGRIRRFRFSWRDGEDVSLMMVAIE